MTINKHRRSHLGTAHSTASRLHLLDDSHIYTTYIYTFAASPKAGAHSLSLYTYRARLCLFASSTPQLVYTHRIYIINQTPCRRWPPELLAYRPTPKATISASSSVHILAYRARFVSPQTLINRASIYIHLDLLYIVYISINIYGKSILNTCFA